MSRKNIKILFIGDIVGKPGRAAVKMVLPGLKEQESLDLVIANGENLAGGKGLTFEKYQEMLDAGVDYFTTGNHVWKNRDIIPFMKERSVKVLRPANYPDDPPGLGFDTIAVGDEKIILINLIGRVFINGLFDDPFAAAKEIVQSNPNTIKIIDFHAEATSEKAALAYYLDGEVSAVFGTHTHVQTADERILNHGTAFISDVGMCGPIDSVLGVDKDIIIQGFLTGLPQSHKVAVGDSVFSACLIEIDSSTKKAISIKRFYELVK